MEALQRFLDPPFRCPGHWLQELASLTEGDQHRDLDLNSGCGKLLLAADHCDSVLCMCVNHSLCRPWHSSGLVL